MKNISNNQHIIHRQLHKLIVMLICVIPFNTIAQSPSSRIFNSKEAYAEECFKSYRYLQAIDAYLPIVKKDSN
ncbi:MAG: hypothetical protein V4651_02570, partial [Bacteroidota bacterium]